MEIPRFSFRRGAPEGSAAQATGPGPTSESERPPLGYQIRETQPVEEKQAQRKAVVQERRRRVVERAYQFIDYAFLVLYGLLGVRLLLQLVAANEATGFVRFVDEVTQPFYAPFVDIVPSTTFADGGVFELSILVCMLAYVLLQVAVRGLLHLFFGTRRPI
jgi:uncharacterized protein YggT (Ycf19 family)